jgi:hypothetical protein
MTIKQKVLLLGCGIIAAYLFTWPLSLLLIWFFAEVNGDIKTIPEAKE